MRRIGSQKRYLIWAGLVVIVLVLPLVFDQPYHVGIGVTVGIYAIATMGLIMLMGYAGQISLGQAAFYGIGAYSSGILTTRYDLSPWLALLVGAALAALIAIVAGRYILRLRGFVLAGATYAIGIIFFTLFENLTDWTGGVVGLGGIPRLSIGPFVFDSDLHYYYLVWFLGLLLLVYSLNVVNSKVGRALRSMQSLSGSGEEVAQSLGVDVARYKIQVFALSAVYASIAGSLYAHYITFIDPSSFTVMESIIILLMVVFGGMGSLPGSFVGAAILVIFPELLRFLGMPSAVAAPLRQMIYGLLLIVLMLKRPQGILGQYRFR